MSGSDDPTKFAADAATDALAKTAEKVFDSEVAKTLLMPAATEIGQTLGMFASAFRFYSTRNMDRIFKAWSKERRGATVSVEEFERVMPLLPAASLISDEGLHEAWAKLLQTFSSGDATAFPSFVTTLSQLTSQEARFLNLIWLQPPGSIPRDRYLRFYVETFVKKTRLTGRRLHDYVLHTVFEFNILFSDLLRLGLFERKETHHLTNDGEKVDEYGFSAYGTRFMMSIARCRHKPN